MRRLWLQETTGHKMQPYPVPYTPRHDCTDYAGRKCSTIVKLWQCNCVCTVRCTGCVSNTSSVHIRHTLVLAYRWCTIVLLWQCNYACTVGCTTIKSMVVGVAVKYHYHIRIKRPYEKHSYRRLQEKLHYSYIRLKIAKSGNNIANYRAIFPEIFWNCGRNWQWEAACISSTLSKLQ